MSRIKGITIEIGGDTSKLDKAIRDVTTSTKSLDKELRGINYGLRLDPKNVTLLGEKYKVLTQRVKESSDKVELLKKRHKEAAQQFKNGEISDKEFREISRELGIAEAELKKFKKQLKEVGNGLTRLGKDWKKAGDQMTSVGKSLTTKVTAPIVAVGALATKAAIDYETAFTGVIKTTDATEEELANLSKGIRDMAKEIPVAATRIAEVAEVAGQLGVETPNILDFTRVMLDLSVAAENLSAEDAAASLARLANITGMSQKDFDKLGSVIVDLGNNFATTEKEIIDMALRLAGAGSQVGMTEAEILSFAAALSSVGIEAAAGGSAFSKVMVEMQLAVETGSESLQDFASVAGMSAEEFSVAFKEDAAGAINAFIGGLATSEERGLSAIKVLDDMGLTEVRLRDALLRAAGASDTFTEAVGSGTKAWEENTALASEANLFYGTTENQLQLLKNSLTDLAISFGEHILPHVISLAEWLGQLAEKFGGLDEETQKTILTVLAVVAALGPFLAILGSIVKVVGTVMSVVGALGGAFAALTGPVGIAVAAIAGVIAIGVALYKNWDEVVAFAKNLWENIKNIFSGIASAISNAWGSVKTATANAWNSVKSTVSSIASGISTSVSSVFNGIKSKVSGVWNSIKTATTNAWNAVKTSITTPINSAKTAVSNAIARVKEILSGSLSFPKIKLPRFSITGRFSLKPLQVPRLGIEWYDKGGIFSAPAVIGVGEKRPEFVGALEDLRYLIGDELDKRTSRGSGEVNITVGDVHIHDDRDVDDLMREIAWRIRKEMNLEPI